MRFIADLHIHSKHSRATSKQCDLPNIEAWARIKGIGVVGTGDFTHPGWFSELSAGLTDSGGGLFAIRPELRQQSAVLPPPSCPAEARFMLTAEISSIYKRGGRTRKVHNVVLAPSMEAAAGLSAALDRIGNIRSDGRPILGLDSKDLLELVLEKAPGARLVPAHVWTPWFSLFGSNSGFDSIEECFGDLTKHVFALETGLSSDPLMNRRVSALDRYSLISNSDAHSPANLGREANVFDCEQSFDAMMRALETGVGFLGTFEFFPEEGKYHLDGHRKCDVRMTPEETRAANGLCPTCGKPVTVGVLNRVAELADRPQGFVAKAKPGFSSLVPLREVLSECLDCGPETRKVRNAYFDMIAGLGPELLILSAVDLSKVASEHSPLVAEALRRVKAGDVFLEGGFDGEYGTVKVFRPGERERLTGQAALFAVPNPDAPVAAAGEARDSVRMPEPLPLFSGGSAPGDLISGSSGLNEMQREAVFAGTGPLAVVAGPGTGKTFVISNRIARLVADGLAEPASIAAITFTNRAAAELTARLCRLLKPEQAEAVFCGTFHSLCARILRLDAGREFRVAGAEESKALFAEAARVAGFKGRKQLAALEAGIAAATREGLTPAMTAADPKFGPGVFQAYEAFRGLMRESGVIDFDGLMVDALDFLGADAAARGRVNGRWKWVFVDEYQDVDAAQYKLLNLLAPAGSNICVIGDPDQAIYGFRGSNPEFFRRFEQDRQGARIVRLTRNYRSTDTILSAATQVIAGSGGSLNRVESGLAGTLIVRAALATEKAEAEFVAHSIEKEIGGVSFFSRDSGRVGEAAPRGGLSFSDFAVLARTDAMLDPVAAALDRLGIPHSRAGSGRLSSVPGVTAVLEALRSAGCGCDAARTVRELRETLDEPARSAAALLAPMADGFAGDAPGFAERVALGLETDAIDPRADRVSCVTMHASKGLEFPVVFVIGCEDGIVPLRFGPSGTDVEEERRLFFVAVTRAGSQLYLTRAAVRRRRGRIEKNPESPFLSEVDESLLQEGGLPGQRKPRKPRQLELFQ